MSIVDLQPTPIERVQKHIPSMPISGRDILSIIHFPAPA